MIMATTVNLLVNSYLVNADKKLKQKKVDLMTLTENHSVGKWCDGVKYHHNNDIAAIPCCSDGAMVFL